MCVYIYLYVLCFSSSCFVLEDVYFSFCIYLVVLFIVYICSYSYIYLFPVSFQEMGFIIFSYLGIGFYTVILYMVFLCILGFSVPFEKGVDFVNLQVYL